MIRKTNIRNSSGEKLAGLLHVCPNSKKLAIICHGMLCNKGKYFIPALARALQKKGINAYRFDFAGNGGSDGKSEDCTLSKEIEDIKAVVDFFRSKSYQIYGLIGHSRGAADILLHQAKYSSAEKLVEIAAVVDQRTQTIHKYSKQQIAEMNRRGFFTIRLWGKKFKVTKKYFVDRTGYGDIRRYLRRISAPVLVVHGTADRENGVQNAKVMIKSLNKKSRLALVKGANHFFSSQLQAKKMIRIIVRWFAEARGS